MLFQLSIADDSGKRESAFRVFNTTPGIIEKQHEEAVAQAFTKGFKDPEVGVRTQTPLVDHCAIIDWEYL